MRFFQDTITDVASKVGDASDVLAVWMKTVTGRGGSECGVGAAHRKIHFFWNVEQELFPHYSMLQGRAGIQALIKSAHTAFFFFLCFTTTSFAS